MDTCIDSQGIKSAFVFMADPERGVGRKHESEDATPEERQVAAAG
jgi:hypothetical protein